VQTVTYPLDLVRRRMQVQALAAAGAPALGNTWTALRDIARSQGWRGLFSGLSINYMKVPRASRSHQLLRPLPERCVWPLMASMIQLTSMTTSGVPCTT
jgi:Mitochondrial carrier protein